MTMTSQFIEMTLFSFFSFFFVVVLFLLLILVPSPSFMSISSLVLELWQFFFIRDSSEIWKSDIPRSEVCPISGDSGELGIPNLAQMSLIKCYWWLNLAICQSYSFYHFWFIKGKPTGQGGLRQYVFYNCLLTRLWRHRF